MTRHLSVPVKSVCAFSILLSATALSGVPAFAANNDVIDGLPSARTCAQLGFSSIDRDEEGGNGRTRSGGGGVLRQFGTTLGLAPPKRRLRRHRHRHRQCPPKRRRAWLPLAR